MRSFRPAECRTVPGMPGTVVYTGCLTTPNLTNVCQVVFRPRWRAAQNHTALSLAAVHQASGEICFLPLTIEGLALPLGLAFEPNDVRMDE